MKNFRGQAVVVNFNDYLYIGYVMNPATDGTSQPWVTIASDMSLPHKSDGSEKTIVYRVSPLPFEDFPEDLNALSVYFEIVYDEKKSKKR